jgi:glycosyltransferase involved in cell wall biosynthesis
MDCLVLPSRTTPDWKEQFGLVLAQAMLCGVPVIGSDSGAIPETIGEAGLLFPEGDTDALAAHIRRLMQRPEMRAELAAVGRRWGSARYSATALAAETAALLDEIAGTTG